MAFEPVRTKADLDSLDADEIFRGYVEWNPDDPEPGANRGRAYWHGWCNRRRDAGHEPSTVDALALAREVSLYG